MVMVVAASVAAVVVARGGGGGEGGGFCLRRAELHEQRAEVVVQRHTLGVGVGLLLARGAEERQRARAREGLLMPPPRPVAAPHRVERCAARHRRHPPCWLRRRRRLRLRRCRVRAVRSLGRVAPVQPAARARLAHARRLRVPELAEGCEARGRGRVPQRGGAEARVLERGLRGGEGRGRERHQWRCAPARMCTRVDGVASRQRACSIATARSSKPAARSVCARRSRSSR